MNWVRRGRKIVRTRTKWVRRAVLAAALALAPCFSARAGGPQLASTQAPSTVSQALRSMQQRQEFAAATTAVAHRIPIPYAPGLQLRFSTLEGTLDLLARGGPLHAKLQLLGFPCRAIDPNSDEIRLRCASGRIDATLVTVKGQRYLDLRELRGLPTNDGEEGPPRIAYPQALFGSSGGCPGDNDAAKGECAFDKGDDFRAQDYFLSALRLADPIRRFAALRLGDLALRRRDPNGALAFYIQAGDQGLWGRLASERLCEVTGSCFDDTLMQSFDAAGLPDSVRIELELREIRMLALLGRWSESMEHLSSLLDASPGSCTDDNKTLCRRVVLAALRTPACSRESALSSYLRLPGFLSGQLAAELAAAAGHDSGELGAPAYGAALMSATVRVAARSDLLTHARETIALYQLAGDPWRAHVMHSWATTRLTPQEIAQLPPDDEPVVAGRGGDSQNAIAADLDTDEAKAALLIAKSTLARSRISALAPPPPRKKR